MRGTTSLEREIITHYWTRSGPWKGGSENWTIVDYEIVERYLSLGILRVAVEGHIEANREAVEVYMDALSRVPLPIQRWIVLAKTEDAP